MSTTLFLPLHFSTHHPLPLQHLRKRSQKRESRPSASGLSSMVLAAVLRLLQAFITSGLITTRSTSNSKKANCDTFSTGVSTESHVARRRSPVSTSRCGGILLLKTNVTEKCTVLRGISALPPRPRGLQEVPASIPITRVETVAYGAGGALSLEISRFLGIMSTRVYACLRRSTGVYANLRKSTGVYALPATGTALRGIFAFPARAGGFLSVPGALMGTAHGNRRV